MKHGCFNWTGGQHLGPKTSNAIFATVAGKGTCGCNVGEMEDVYNGLFSVLYVTKNI